jgi:hypothetical protein
MVSRWLPSLLGIGLLSFSSGLRAESSLSSYANAATDVVGSTGASAVALGVPDYRFVNDAGLGFGGTNTDVFDAGEAVELAFPTALRNVSGQHDLVLSAFVGGLGSTDDAQVRVEARTSTGTWVVIDVFDTAEARSRQQDWPENDFAGVKHFYVELGALDEVTHVRLTNLASTAEGLRLDAVEGLHPVLSGRHAFELRIERYRPDFNQRFLLRIKNIAGPAGVPIREFRIVRSTAPGATLQSTLNPLVSVDGDLICIENCIPDNGPLIPFSRHVWSEDGTSEAPPGTGLEPGRQAANLRSQNFDLDTANTTYLSGYSFEVTFADGVVHGFDYDAHVLKEIGNLYQKYLYFSTTPVESWPRPVDYYEYVDATGVPTLPGVLGRLFTAALVAAGAVLALARRASTSGGTRAPRSAVGSGPAYPGQTCEAE